MKKIAAAMALAALAGCAMGITDSSPHLNYEVDRPYQLVHDRAVHQAEECMQGVRNFEDRLSNIREPRRSEFRISENVSADARQGEVLVSDPLTGVVVARTQWRALGPDRTAVTQAVWGRGTWDGKTLHAMEQSILMDASVCTVYKIAE